MTKIERVARLCAYHERDRIQRYYLNSLSDCETYEHFSESITYGLLEGEDNMVSEYFAAIGGYDNILEQHETDAFYRGIDTIISAVINWKNMERSVTV